MRRRGAQLPTKRARLCRLRCLDCHLALERNFVASQRLRRRHGERLRVRIPSAAAAATTITIATTTTPTAAATSSAAACTPITSTTAAPALVRM
jgi:hypothetical protein